MSYKAFKAIRTAAEAAGATSVAEDGTTTVVAYNGSEIRIAMLMGVETGWRIEIDGLGFGSEKAPSKAFKSAVKVIDARRAREASDLEGIHNVAADKGAEIVSIEADNVVLTYEGHEVVAAKPVILWTVTCEGEQLSHGSMNAWSGLKLAIGTLEERAQAAADREAKLEDMEEVVETAPRGRMDDFCTEEDMIEDEEHLKPLTTFEAVRNAMDEAFQQDHVDHTTPVAELREVYDITDAVEDHEIREALALAVRDDFAPLLVLTLGSDRVEIQVPVGTSDDALDFAFLRAEHELSEIAGETVTLQRVGDHDEGDGVLRAYRMPQGDYYADDVGEVQLFGVEVGRYRMVTEDERMLAELTEGLAGQCYEKAEVRGGVVTVGFYDAPGAPAGWCVDLTATGERVLARFDHEDGRVEHVAWEPSQPEEQELGIRDFLRSPASWSEHMWRIVECRAADAVEDLDRRRALAFEDGERWLAGDEPDIGDDSRAYAQVLEKRHGLLKGDGLRAMRGKFAQPEAAA